MSTNHGILLHMIFSTKYRKQASETEYLGFLKKPAIEFDPKYAFEMETLG